jgi:hypothetical protein
MKTLLLFAPTMLAAGMMTGPVALQIKMGLWEETIVSSMKLAGASSPTASTTKMHVCLTPDHLFAPKNCKTANVEATAKHYAADLSCPSMTGHMGFDFSSPDAGHGTMHLDVVMGAYKATGDTTTDMHFLGASCGAVSPDHPQPVK